MKVVYFLIIFSFVITIHAQDRKTAPLRIPQAQSPGSSSPSSASFSGDLWKTPKSWDSGKDDGNLTDDLREMKSSTDFDEASLRFVSPLQSPRDDQDEGSVNKQQKKSYCAKFFCCLCCCCWREQKTSSQYKEIS